MRRMRILGLFAPSLHAGVPAEGGKAPSRASHRGGFPSPFHCTLAPFQGAGRRGQWGLPIFLHIEADGREGKP